MSDKLVPGQSREFTSRWSVFSVSVEYEDADTPRIYIIKQGTQFSVEITDIDAKELIIMLKKALAILPTSK